jgi:hypothetical protein
MICVGESHMACVVAAAHEAGMPLEAIGLKPAVGRELNRTGRTPDSKDADLALVHPTKLGEHADRLNGPVLSFVGGKGYLLLGMQRHPVPFDFVYPDDPSLLVEPDAMLIPFRAVHAAVGARAMGQLYLLEHILRVSDGGPVYQFESPPPPAQKWLERNRGKGFAGRVAGPVLRHKLWRVHCDVVREHAEQHGCPYVPSPPSARDEQGLLREDLCGNAAHANVAYGALVLEQIRSIAAEGAPSNENYTVARS